MLLCVIGLLFRFRGHNENGQDGREDLKQDGGLRIRHLGPSWPRVARVRRLWKHSSLRSERHPGAKW